MLGNTSHSASGTPSHLLPGPLDALGGQLLALSKSPGRHFFSASSSFGLSTNKTSRELPSLSAITPFDHLNFVDLKTDDGRLKCPICCLLCRDKCVLRNHYRVHSGEKPFACPFCPYKANQKSSLKTHILLQHKSLAVE